MPERLGQQLGNYRLIRFLEQGNFGEVYLGEHIHLGTLAAIKVMRADLAEQQRSEQFRAEARVIARLTHPHIVRVLEFDVQRGTPFLVMDYAPNGSLRQLHPKGQRAPLSTIVPYVKQIADALQYAHDQQLVHRDIKPENLLLGRNHEILLSDFGIAVVLQQSRSHLTVPDFAGTPDYMAPEQFQGQASQASDQYALAEVVYEWLAGDLPFHASDAFALGVQKLQMDPPPLFFKVPKTPVQVEQVVLKALARTPEERFATVQDFAQALEQASQAQPINQQAHISQATTVVSGKPTVPPGQESVTDRLPRIRGARAWDILNQVRKKKRQEGWRVYKANSSFRYLCFALPIFLFVVAAILGVLASTYQLDALGNISVGGMFLLGFCIIGLFVGQEELGHFDWLVFMPEGCIIQRSSDVISIDYSTIDRITWGTTGTIWWRPTERSIYYLVIDDAYEHTQWELAIDGHFAPAKLIAREIIVAHQEFISRSKGK